jgi:tetratricopeptide (TPR) repeat protein
MPGPFHHSRCDEERTMLTDIRGHQLTGATDKGLKQFEQASHLLTLFSGDPVSTVDAAIKEGPDFVMAHALRAWLHILACESGALPNARASLDAARQLTANRREQMHLGAIEHLIEGRWHAGSRVLEDIAIEYPRDLLALQVGHQMDFFRGDSRMLRDRIARALPAWTDKTPAYHAMLGMYAFGLEEMGDYGRAEKFGRMAVDLEPRDGWAQHSVAHVLEMQSRQQEGINWMEKNVDGWSRESFFAVHNWWHLALYYLELGDFQKVLGLYDKHIYPGGSKVVLELIDASAMLWRLYLRGVPAGQRWDTLADAWEATGEFGSYAFNDAHAVMAFVGAGRQDSIRRVFEAQFAAMQRPDDNAAFTSEVGHPVAKALDAFGQGRYADVNSILRPVRNIAARFGGSHAQRDLLDLTMIEAALRAGDEPLAQALTAERAAQRHESPLSRLFLSRAASMNKAA